MSLYIIAEIGSNWLNDKGERNYLEQVKMAKECGADAVKFQLLSYKELYGVDKPGNTLDKYKLRREEIKLISKHCKSIGIDFLCSAFSEDGYKFVDQFVHMHKIASSEATHTDLVNYVLSLGKYVMISIGGLTSGSIIKLVNNPLHAQIVLAECVPKYPASIFDYDFDMIGSIEIISENEVAFSDHTIGSDAAMIAKNMGVEIFEKHVDFLGSTKNPDSAVSINASEFRNYCSRLKASPKFKRASNPSRRIKLDHGFFRPEPG